MTPAAGGSLAEDAAAALRAEPGRAVIAMDFDGTLAPIVPDPRHARAHPEAASTLRRLGPLIGRLAVITGRAALTAVKYAGLAEVVGVVVLGHYGLERWQAGVLRSPPPAAGISTARQRLPALLAGAGVPDAVVEDKGHALAVHLRRAARPRDALQALRAPLRELADETGLVVEAGRLVLELRPPGVDKGGALRALLAEDAAARPPSVVVFIGDDLADLPAFDEVERLRADGVPGLLVCSGSSEVPEVAERADLVVDGPEGVVAWLQQLVEALAPP